MNELPHRPDDSTPAGPEIDPVLAAFLPGQTDRAMELADESDILSLEPLAKSPYRDADASLSEAAIRGLSFFLGSNRGNGADPHDQH